MRVTTIAPTSGQFSAVWTYAGKSWCTTFRFVDGVLYERNPLDGAEATQWAPSRACLPAPGLQPVYFTA